MGVIDTISPFPVGWTRAQRHSQPILIDIPTGLSQVRPDLIKEADGRSRLDHKLETPDKSTLVLRLGDTTPASRSCRSASALETGLGIVLAVASVLPVPSSLDSIE